MIQTLEGAKAPGKPEKASHNGAGEPPQAQQPVVAVTPCVTRYKTTVVNRNVTNRNNPPGSGWGALLPAHGAELEASGIAPDVAALNVASFGPGTDRHWETERGELVRFKRLAIQTKSVTASGHPQTQPGHLSAGLAKLDRCYRHLAEGGWRTLSDSLPGLDLPIFDQWKPAAPEPKYKRDPRTNEWRLVLDEHGLPRLKKYEAPPGCPDGGGLLLPRVPDRCWEAIARRHGLPFPEARGDGFWAWVLATPSLPLLVCEGWKKALAAVSAGHAAVALPGATMGRRVAPDRSERLIPALQALAKGRPLTVALDAERKPSTARKMAAAAGALARCLRIAKGKPAIAWLPLLPGADKTGLDDLWVAGGPEALDRALADTAPRPVLPRLRPPDRIAPAGVFLAEACTIPPPEEAPLVILQAPMGCGKTHAIEEAIRPLRLEGVPVVVLSHRTALGQALARQVGVPWRPMPGSDERLQGFACCVDSLCRDSALRIAGDGWSGAVVVLDEWMQQAEHLLLGTGTALTDRTAPRRAAVLRALAELLARARLVIASDAQMAEWGVALLEALTGRRALVIASQNRPMAGRPLHCPAGFTTPQKAAEAFRGKLAQTVADLPAGGSLLVWTSAQKGEKSQNAPVNLAQWHRSHRPGDLVDVIDSATPDLAAELAADPDGFAERRIKEAAAQGGSWVLYCSPAVSSGISFQRWRPAAVIACSGGRIAPEHVAQALARVRCPEVSCWIFAPERSPGAALRVESGNTDSAGLIADLRKAATPLLGALQESGSEEAWLKAWGELGAIRNRQTFAYRATIAGLLQREGWALQEPGPEPCSIAGAALGAELKAIRDERREAKQQAILTAEPLTAMEAARLERRRTLEPSESAARERYRLAERWGMAPDSPLTLELLVADEDRPADRLKLAWLLSCPEAIALVPAHDRLAIARLDPEHRRPFDPDRLRVTLEPKVAALWDLGIPGLLERFKSGEAIAATDPAVLALHANAKKHVATLGVSPGKRPSGSLRNLLRAVGWELKGADRIKARTGEKRDVCTYSAAPIPLPEGVTWEALTAKWMAELRGGGAKNAPIERFHRGEKCPNHPPHPSPPLLKRSPLAPAVAVPWPSGPPRPRPTGFAVVA
jgi:hypothetical protein